MSSKASTNRRTWKFILRAGKKSFSYPHQAKTWYLSGSRQYHNRQSIRMILCSIGCGFVRWSGNSVRFDNLMGIGFQKGQILWDFISQCEIWHVWVTCRFIDLLYNYTPRGINIKISIHFKVPYWYGIVGSQIDFIDAPMSQSYCSGTPRYKIFILFCVCYIKQITLAQLLKSYFQQT